MPLDAASEAVLGFDYSKVRERCMRRLGWSGAFVDRVLVEYKRFLVLKVRCESATGNAELSPSDTLDALWHLHVLDTADYSVKLAEACGRVILHDLDGADDVVSGRERRAEKTRLCYVALFNATPPVDIWDYNFEEMTQAAVVAHDAPAANDHRSAPFSGRARRKRDRRSRSSDYVNVRTQRGEETLTIPLNLGSCTVGSLKHKLQDAQGIRIPPKEQRLVFAGKQLEDHMLLADYGVTQGSTIFLALRLRAC